MNECVSGFRQKPYDTRFYSSQECITETPAPIRLGGFGAVVIDTFCDLPRAPCLQRPALPARACLHAGGCARVGSGLTTRFNALWSRCWVYYSGSSFCYCCFGPLTKQQYLKKQTRLVTRKRSVRQLYRVNPPILFVSYRQDGTKTVSPKLL